MRYVTLTTLIVETALQIAAIGFIVHGYRVGDPDVGAFWLAIGFLFEVGAIVLAFAWLVTVFIRWRLRVGQGIVTFADFADRSGGQAGAVMVRPASFIYVICEICG
jgi:hypothetical protein